jgi:hypothetical protein
VIASGAIGNYFSWNKTTTHLVAGIGKWTDWQIVGAMTKGVSADVGDSFLPCHSRTTRGYTE